MHPSAGEGPNWWRRLNKALGTTSSDFVNASLFQIQAACRSPWGGISELAMNAALAMIAAAGPKDEIEGALAVQLGCTHAAGPRFRRHRVGCKASNSGRATRDYDGLALHE